MKYAEALAGITEILVEDYGMKREEITPDKRLNDLGIDSLGVSELAIEIEDGFDIDATDDLWNGEMTVDDAARYVAKNAKSPAPSA